MTPEELYEKLKPLQEKKGFYLSKDKNLVLSLLKGLIQNKEKYGYMVCPCRLSLEDRDADKDIICPCDYREEDINEFGSCYCNLYVSKEWNNGEISHEYVPERRSPDKMFGDF